MLVGGVLLLIDSFFHWQSVSIGPITASRNAWHGWGVIAGLLTIVLVVWLAARVAAADLRLPVSDTLAGAALAVLILLFTFLKFIVDNEFRTFWAWLGLILAVLIAVGAWLQVQMGGGVDTLRTEASGMRDRGAGATAPPPAAPPESPPPPPAGDESPPAP